MSSFGRRRLMPLLLVVCGFLALPGTALGAVIWDEETGEPAALAEIPVEATLSWATGWGGFEDCTVDGVLVVDESAEYATLPAGLTQDAACTQGTGGFTGCTIESADTAEAWTDLDALGVGEGFFMTMHIDAECGSLAPWGAGHFTTTYMNCNSPLAIERESEETPLKDGIPLAYSACVIQPSGWGGASLEAAVDGSLRATEGEWVIKD